MNKTLSRRAELLAITSAIALFVCNTTQAKLIDGLFSTGVNDQGHLLGMHEVDPHYAVVGPAGAPSLAFVAPMVYHPGGNQAWVNAPAGSAWIGPSETDDTYPIGPAGDYHYLLTIEFDLTGHDLSLVQISGLWATDNTGKLFLNGEDTGFNKELTGFTHLDAFLLQGHFRDGINRLEFRVNNEYGPTGLLVAGLEAANDGSLTMPIAPEPEFGPPLGSSVPETSSFIINVSLLLPLGFGFVRRLILKANA